MRLPLLISALLTLVTACAEGQRPRPLVVLVHGRGHLDDDTAAIRREWKRDLDTALARAGARPLDDADVRLAWYADALDPSRAPSCARLTTMQGASDTLGPESVATDFLAGLANALPSGESRGARMLLGDMLYALDGRRRCAAQERVSVVLERAAREGRPVVLVAYSLGSLVAYQALSAGSATRRERTAFVTLGSPLGDRDIRALLGVTPDTLRIPPGVDRWENVYDPGDVFASPLDGAVRGVRDVPLSTRGADVVEAHLISRYLRDAATGVALARALCAVGGRQEPACKT